MDEISGSGNHNTTEYWEYDSITETVLPLNSGNNNYGLSLQPHRKYILYTEMIKEQTLSARTGSEQKSV